MATSQQPHMEFFSAGVCISLLQPFGMLRLMRIAHSESGNEISSAGHERKRV